MIVFWSTMAGKIFKLVLFKSYTISLQINWINFFLVFLFHSNWQHSNSTYSGNPNLSSYSTIYEWIRRVRLYFSSIATNSDRDWWARICCTCQRANFMMNSKLENFKFICIRLFSASNFLSETKKIILKCNPICWCCFFFLIFLISSSVLIISK